jgi:hypothetical protein
MEGDWPAVSYICVGFTLLGGLASPHLWSPSCPYQTLINHFQEPHQAFLVTVAVLRINSHCTSPQRSVPYFCCPTLVMMTPRLDFEGHVQALWCKLVVFEANKSNLTSLFNVHETCYREHHQWLCCILITILCICKL